MLSAAEVSFGADGLKKVSIVGIASKETGAASVGN